MYIQIVWNVLSWQCKGYYIKARYFWAFVALLQSLAVGYRGSTGSLLFPKKSQVPFLKEIKGVKHFLKTESILETYLHLWQDQRA